MKYFKRIFIFVTLGLLGLAHFLRQERWDNPDYFIRKKDALLRLTNSSKELHRIWFDGEDSKEWTLVKTQCLKKFGITDSFDESMLRCHPMLISCVDDFLDKKPFNLSQISFQYPHYIFSLKDNQSSEQLDIALADNCHELYLEQNTYVYGEAPKVRGSEDYQFDNFNRHIYFDQHMVTNSEINEWLKYDQSAATKGLVPQSLGNNLFLPAGHLTLKQMHNYCSYKGKQLMLAHFFDAATFLTQDRNRSPYYWTKKRSERDNNCEYIFSKECIQEKKL